MCDGESDSSEEVEVINMRKWFKIVNKVSKVGDCQWAMMIDQES